jgi:dihydrofolate synthase/folylpolyglutamate synthase
MQIGGRPIDPDTFGRLTAATLAAADRIPRRLGDPTEFEILTAMLFRWFADERIDLAVVEVGLGGRLDATHAWDGGVAAITNVDLDHTDRLGTTIAAIAREKAAIVERGDVAVTGATGVALAIIRRRAARLAVPLTVVSPARLIDLDREGIDVDLPRLGRTRIGLRGRHQAANVAVADAVLDALETAGIATIPSAARREGYATVRWPGRLELLAVDGRDVLLDGAHNPSGAATLARALDDMRPHLASGRLTLVTASMADKDVDGIVAELSVAAALSDAIVITTQVDLPRALPAAALAARWRARGKARTVVAEPDPELAFDRALAGADGPIVVAGSLYLVGAVRARLVDDPLFRDPAGVAVR